MHICLCVQLKSGEKNIVYSLKAFLSFFFIFLGSMSPDPLVCSTFGGLNILSMCTPSKPYATILLAFCNFSLSRIIKFFANYEAKTRCKNVVSWKLSMYQLVSNQPWTKSKCVIDQSECTIIFCYVNYFVSFYLGSGEGGYPQKNLGGIVGHVL